DLISKDKIAIQVKYMEENELSTISFTDVKYFKHGEFGLFFNTLELNNENQQKKEVKEDFLENLIRSNFTPVNTPLIRASFIIDKALNFNSSLKALEVWDFWLRCAFNGATFNYIDEATAIAYVRVHNNSMIHHREY